MGSAAEYWRALATRLRIKVVTPASVDVGDERATFTALLPQFGGARGMIVDADWEVIEPRADKLWSLGYGYSAVEVGPSTDDQNVQEMLRDWGWTAPEPTPDWW